MTTSSRTALAASLVLLAAGCGSSPSVHAQTGSAATPATATASTYGVKFPMFSKTVVKGRQANPLFAELAKATGNSPAWNFHKYLVDRRGQAIASFSSETTPLRAPLVTAIERALTSK